MSAVDGASFELELEVNGRFQRLAISCADTLLEVLRDRLGLTGAKRFCDMQICGACTVLLDGRAVSSCCLLAADAHGRSVETIEALADDTLHPLQQQFIEHGAFQCGYCTPGMIMAARALLAENEAPSEQEIRDYLDGNLCRCGAYPAIVRAISAAVEELRRARRG